MTGLLVNRISSARSALIWPFRPKIVRGWSGKWKYQYWSNLTGTHSTKIHLKEFLKAGWMGWGGGEGENENCLLGVQSSAVPCIHLVSNRVFFQTECLWWKNVVRCVLIAVTDVKLLTVLQGLGNSKSTGEPLEGKTPTVLQNDHPCAHWAVSHHPCHVVL